MARWTLGLGLLVGVGVVGAVVVGACLPGLTPSLCGNGHIDYGESCDPGANTNAGCTSFCQIICPNTPEDGGRAFLDSPSSNHCYFTSNSLETFDNGTYTCGLQDAHLVTFVDDNEVAKVVANLGAAWPEGAGYWVGFYRQSPSGPYSAAAPNEPGWATGENSVGFPYACTGCFLHGLVSGPPPDGDGGAEAGPAEAILSADLSYDDGTMEAMGRRVGAQVVCEREPVGSRSVPCLDGMFCFDVLVTETSDAGRSKRYVYNPTPLTASSAEAYCRGITDGGASSLVVFSSRAEREQVIYELSQVSLLQGGGSGLEDGFSFWIGLTGQVVGPDGGAPVDAGPDAGAPTVKWLWDDGVQAYRRPMVWGNGEPVAPNTKSPSQVRAFVELYDSYDTGLAHARAATPGAPHYSAAVCQY
jgi:hypothetical protein